MSVAFRQGAAAWLLLAAPALGQGAAPVDRPTLTVRGSATVERRPDRAEISILVATRGPTNAAAMAAHRDRVARATAVLRGLAAGGVAVDAGTFGLSEERVPAPPGPRPGGETVGYRATTRYDLTLSTIDALGAVMGDIASAGLFEIGDVRFSSGDEAAALDDARRAAMADARRHADVYADAAVLRLDGVERIAGDGGGDRFTAQGATARSAWVGIVPPKALQFSDSVVVTWRVAPR